eukprot:2405945-Rhodomonas_salina.1
MPAARDHDRCLSLSLTSLRLSRLHVTGPSPAVTVPGVQRLPTLFKFMRVTAPARRDSDQKRTMIAHSSPTSSCQRVAPAN